MPRRAPCTSFRRDHQSRRRAGPACEPRWKISVYVETNITGGLNLLELCRQFGVKKFTLASTSSLYGQGLPTPYHEDLNTDHPLSPYAATKKAAEAMAYTYHYLHGIDVSALRYFTVYGPAGRRTWPRSVLSSGSARAGPSSFLATAPNRAISPTWTISRRAPSRPPAGRLSGVQPRLGPAAEAQRNDRLDRGTNREEGPDRIPEGSSRRRSRDLGRYFQGAQDAGAWEPQTSFRKGLQNLVSWYEENRDWASKIHTD